MTRGILIAGNNSPLLTALAEEAARRVEHFVATFIPDQSDKTLTVSSAEMLNWNPGSPIAARTLLLGAENRLGQVNEAILVCAPPRLCPEHLDSKKIENLVSDHIKGWLLLVKELTAAFRARKTGTLAMVLSKPAEDLLAPVASAAFQAFAQGLLITATSEPFQTIGFSPPDNGDEASFAAFIFKIIDEGNKKNNGRWQRYGKLFPSKLF
ncbi:MAG: hypothetical protein LBI40_03300 [Treponema sp.]|jgi:hypothetical protein|nr:hypothetical protein [Treponema sp.]